MDKCRTVKFAKLFGLKIKNEFAKLFIEHTKVYTQRKKKKR